MIRPKAKPHEVDKDAASLSSQEWHNTKFLGNMRSFLKTHNRDYILNI